jgi:cbb3-type cytochrome oxidase subunit 3
MLRDVLGNAGWGVLAIIALVIFVVVFVAVVVYVLTRPKKEIRKQAQIPLEDEPVEPRDPD